MSDYDRNESEAETATANTRAERAEAELVALRSENELLRSNARAQGLVDEVGATGKSRRREARKLSRVIHDQRAELRRMTAELAALRAKAAEGLAETAAPATPPTDPAIPFGRYHGAFKIKYNVLDGKVHMDVACSWFGPQVFEGDTLTECIAKALEHYYDHEAEPTAAPTGEVLACPKVRALVATLIDVERVISKSDYWWMTSPDRGGFDLDTIRAVLCALTANGGDHG